MKLERKKRKNDIVPRAKWVNAFSGLNCRGNSFEKRPNCDKYKIKRKILTIMKFTVVHVDVEGRPDDIDAAEADEDGHEAIEGRRVRHRVRSVLQFNVIINSII